MEPNSNEITHLLMLGKSKEEVLYLLMRRYELSAEATEIFRTVINHLAERK